MKKEIEIIAKIDENADVIHKSTPTPDSNIVLCCNMYGKQVKKRTISCSSHAKLFANELSEESYQGFVEKFIL